MKRLVALLCIAVLGINLSGCSLVFRLLKDSSAQQTVKPNVEATFPQQIAPTEQGPVATMPMEPMPTEPTVAPTIAPPVEDEVSYIGTYSQGFYNNRFFDISCVLDDEWVVFDENQLAELMGLTVDMLDNAYLKQQMENGTVVYSLYAQTKDGMVTLNACVEKLNSFNGVLMDEKDYIDVSAAQLPAALESIGMENVQVSPTTMYFAGSTHAALQVYGTIQGISFYETGVCVKVGNYIVFVTAASYLEDVTMDVLALFQPAY